MQDPSNDFYVQQPDLRWLGNYLSSLVTLPSSRINSLLCISTLHSSPDSFSKKINEKKKRWNLCSRTGKNFCYRHEFSKQKSGKTKSLKELSGTCRFPSFVREADHKPRPSDRSAKCKMPNGALINSWLSILKYLHKFDINKPPTG